MLPIRDRVAGWLIAHRRSLAVVALALAAIGVERSRHLEFSRSIDTMFDRADPALVPYRRMARAFGSSEVVLAAYDAPHLFTPAGIEHLRQVTDSLEATPGVASATSLASTPLGSRIIEVDASPTARKLVKLMEGYTLGADHRTAAIACVLQPPAAPSAETSRSSARAQAASRADAIDRIRAIIGELPGAPSPASR